jgi:hypothetical protein
MAFVRVNWEQTRLMHKRGQVVKHLGLRRGSTPGRPKLNKLMSRRRLYLVELFAGSHSVSRCVKRRFRRGYDVHILSVDIDEASDPSIVADINTWRFKDDVDRFLQSRRPHDVVACWSSPPCTAFSRANTLGVRDIHGGAKNVKSGLRVIRHMQPDFWFMENPVGLLKEQPFMRRLDKHINTCSYCRYGRRLYRKNTNIWSNAPLVLKTCSKESPCSSQREHGRHFVTAQSGPTTEARGSGKGENVYGIPCPLVRDLFAQGLEFCGK